ncbi:MAG: GGDEF domain-containing protein [Proteobacteria bacterium]|uniref:diguanylate cyclase n=1 Tax=Aquabacterium sp. TaxID=1872578 RepID=UPI0035C74EAC|nr:GGDEF domain-containing protein [Pseudomonadota bacterium]
MQISPHLLLTAYVALTHTLTTAMWLIGGTWMGLSRRAAAEWMRASLANGVALLITLTDSGGRSTLQMMLACTLAVLGAASLCRGMHAFLRLPQANGAFLRLVGGMAAFDLLLCLPLGWATLGVATSCAVVVVVVLHCAWETHEAIAREFHRGTAAVSSGLLCAIGLTFALTALTAVLSAQHARALPSLEVRQVSLAFVASVLSIMIAFVQGYIVVMRLVNRLQHLSQHDSLTGLLNRRAIEACLAREAHRLQRFNEPYAVLLVDIDHFKRINDQLGHAAGDEVLRSVARTIVDQAREVDRVARYGGEEFCVLLPHTDHDGALQAAERLREAVHGLDIVWRDELISMTVSTGLACATDPHEPLDSLLRRADEALYRAKTEGRNRVVAAPRLQAA